MRPMGLMRLMKFLTAEIEIDGNLRKGVVVDVSEDGAIRSAVSLSDLPCEPANTVYFGGRLRVVNGVVIPLRLTGTSPTLEEELINSCGTPPV